MSFHVTAHLVSSTSLPPEAAQKLLAVAGFESVGDTSRAATRLQQRVLHLQDLLGPAAAAAAIQRFPNIINARKVLVALGNWGGAFLTVLCRMLLEPPQRAFSPEVISSNLQGWLHFFTIDEATGSSPLVGAATRRQGLLMHRLARCPQLLAVNVETLVANLYEIAVICQAQVQPPALLSMIQGQRILTQCF
eukprot:gene9671-9830_t